MKLSLGIGKIVSIVKVTTDKNAKIANSSVTSYTIAGVEVGSVANQLRFILANFTSNRKVLQCHTISLFVEIFENQPNPGYCKIWGLERVIFVATRERQLRICTNCAVLLGRFAFSLQLVARILLILLTFVSSSHSFCNAKAIVAVIRAIVASLP